MGGVLRLRCFSYVPMIDLLDNLIIHSKHSLGDEHGLQFHKRKGKSSMLINVQTGEGTLSVIYEPWYTAQPTNMNRGRSYDILSNSIDVTT